MKSYTPTQTKNRTMLRSTAFALVIITAGVVATLAYQPASSSPPFDVLRGDHGGGGVATAIEGDAGRPTGPPRGSGDHGGMGPGDIGAATVADGVLPDGVTVCDDRYPGVANLDPSLLQALRDAATNAGAEGITFYVNSGWRSPVYQNQLLHEAVADYGSEQEAARWVATAETSAHVSGDAVDLGPVQATAWLSDYGAAYGLCQIYGNEPWHFELRPEAIDQGCPPMYADPTHDPRMQQ
jgi:hypothetical protein